MREDLETRERICRYENYMLSDIRRMKIPTFNVIQSNVSDHLDEIDAFIRIFPYPTLRDNKHDKHAYLAILVGYFEEAIDLYCKQYRAQTDQKYYPGGMDQYNYTLRCFRKEINT